MNDESNARELIEAAAKELGLTVESVFVPWSQSRNKSEPHRSLNWRVTLKRNGREILTTDYSAGVAHCPAYSSKEFGKPGFMSVDRDRAVTQECETGKSYLTFGRPGAPILPDSVDVIAALTRDADILDSGGFEAWAPDFGYDPDSRKAEALYAAIVEIALKMRAGIGEEGLTKLRNAAANW